MRIYVAGKFSEKARVKEMMKILRRDGHTIAFDWTNHDDTGLEGKDRKLYLQACAQDDLDGVESADALVLLAHPDSRGAYVELGVALAFRKSKIVVSGADGIVNVFFELPEIIHVATDADVPRLFR